MSVEIDKQSIVNKLAEALALLDPQNVYIKFSEEINAIEIKIISSVFESLDHLERLKIVTDMVGEILNTDLLEFETLIIPLTDNEVKGDVLLE